MSGHAQPQQCSLRDEELASKQKILHVRQGKASEAVLEIALATGMRRGHPWAPMGRRRSQGRHIARREIRRGDARRQRKGFGGPRWGRLVPLVITLHPSLSGTNSGTNLGQGLSVARSRFCVKASAYVAVPNLRLLRQKSAPAQSALLGAFDRLSTAPAQGLSTPSQARRMSHGAVAIHG